MKFNEISRAGSNPGPRRFVFDNLNAILNICLRLCEQDIENSTG